MTPPCTVTALGVSWALGLVRCVLEHVRKRKGPVVYANWMTATSVSLATAFVLVVLILMGSFLMEGSVILMENVLATHTVTVPPAGPAMCVREHAGKKKGRVVDVNGTTTMSVSLTTAFVVVVLILMGSFLIENIVILMENVTLVLVEPRGKLLVVMQRVDDDLKISRYWC